MVKRVISIFGPNIFIAVAYFFVLLILFHLYGVKFKLDHYHLWSILMTSLFFIYATSTAVHLVRQREQVSYLPFLLKALLKFIRDWFPLIALVTIYENLREYTGIIRTDSIDATLYRLDVLLFGVEPTVWIQKFFHPLLTEYLAFTYSIYFILPLSLAWLLYLMNRRKEFHELTTAVILCLCAGFLLFLIFPAGPPRFYLADLYVPQKLYGMFGYYDALQSRFDGLNPMVYRASFPSLHVALSTFALYYSIRFRHALPLGNIMAAIYSILVVSLWIATVYLRHHWVVDIFAGWMVNAAAIFCASVIQRKIPGPE